MLIRQTPKNPNEYRIINNIEMIHELSELGIMPKYMDDMNHYFIITEELLKYLKEKEFNQWWN